MRVAIPAGIGIVETLDVALLQFERWVDQVLIAEHRDDPEIFATLARQSMSDKIDGLFPDGYPPDDDVYDRYIWPLVQQLELLRARMTRDTATWVAAEWMTAAGFLDDEPDLMPDPSRAPDPAWQVRMDALFASIVEGVGIYVQAWTCEAIGSACSSIPV